jgi:hypothetical protein
MALFARRGAAGGVGLAAGVASLLSAQVPVRTFLLRSGADTVSVERVTRAPGRVEGELLFRSGNQRWHYLATVGPDERVLSLESEVRFAADLPTAPARQSAHFIFAGDSVFVSVTGPNPLQQRLGSRQGAIPYINPSFGLVEQAIRRGLVVKGDSLTLPMFALSGGVTFMAGLARVGADSLVFTLGGVPTRLGIAADGAIRGGVIPAQSLRLEVVEGSMAGAFVTVKPDYSAPADAPYTAIPVRVPTSMGHTLAGTLTLPKGGAGAVPAVVTITGSGPEDRDEAIPPVKGYRPFREVADALGRRGIAVLRMDDRGFGDSEGTFGTATSRDFADDIRAGLAFLRARSDIDGSRLALVGHSEGGLIAPLIAATDPNLKGIVLMAGPAFTGRKILEYQNRYALDRAPNLSPGARDSLMKVALRIMDSTATAQEWMRFFMAYDPTVTARQVHTPVLILQGENDRQVTAEQAPILEQAFRAGGNQDVTMRTYPATNHLFLADPDGNPAGYPGLPTTTIRPEVLRDLAEWLVRRLH